ncbi:hypothetical protein H0H93_009377, partial [Arthromyces matolae]
ITNKEGMIVLAKGGYLIGLGESISSDSFSYHILNQVITDNPLAKDFDILKGRQEVTIPDDTVPGDDYTLVRK